MKKLLCTLFASLMLSSLQIRTFEDAKEVIFLTSSAQETVEEIDEKITASDSQIQKKALQIVKEGQLIFDSAKNLLDKLLYSNYEKDRLTFKDFVWGMMGLCEGIVCNIIRPLKTLRSDIVNDSSLRTALGKVESVANELHTGISGLCKELHPYERTKNTRDSYKIAKILKKHIEGFLTKERFNRLKKTLEEVILILTRKSDYNDLAKELEKLKKALDKVGLNGASVDEAKVLRLIINRIRYN